MWDISMLVMPLTLLGRNLLMVEVSKSSYGSEILIVLFVHASVGKIALICDITFKKEWEY